MSWALRLSRFNFEIEYIKGNSNIADPTSRLLEGTGIDFEDGCVTLAGWTFDTNGRGSESNLASAINVSN